MPVPEGLESSQPGGLQDPPVDDIIDLTEEVVIVPLYGIVQDSPLITAAQKGVRKLKRNEVKIQGDLKAVMDLVTPFLAKIEEEMDKSKGKNKK